MEVLAGSAKSTHVGHDLQGGDCKIKAKTTEQKEVLQLKQVLLKVTNWLCSSERDRNNNRLPTIMVVTKPVFCVLLHSDGNCI